MYPNLKTIEIMEENKKAENPSAFPFTTDRGEAFEGMKLRDYFAGLAMQGICVNAGRNTFERHFNDAIAFKAYEIADAMLKQRGL